MKAILVLASTLGLAACVTPTYRIPPYDGYKRITFKADAPNRVYHYLCKPGASDKEARERGAKAHSFAEQKRAEYFKSVLPPLEELTARRSVEERIQMAKQFHEFWEDAEEDMEAQFDCVFYRTPEQARYGL